MEKKKRTYKLGCHAKRLLLITLPMIMVMLLAFIAILLPLEGGELIKREALILAFFDAVGRGIIFMGIGVILLDYMEKKEEKREE